MKIGMLGCGTIGKFLLEQINQHTGEHSTEKIVAIFSRNKEETRKIATKYDATAYDTFEAFLEADVDLVVEVATIELVHEVALAVIKNKQALIVSSIGAFSDEKFLQEMITECKQNDVHVYIPSGAVGGLDILRSAHVLGGLNNVRLITRKPAYTLQTTGNILEEQTIFQGKAKDAIQQFPRNMNVAIAISLAGIGAEKTEVEVIADPDVDKNIHTITAHGDFGSFTLEVSNKAMPDNPKTSYLAALSVLSSIKEQSSRLMII